MDDDPGPSVAHYFNQDKATENFYRLSQLIMTVCTDLFRDILSRYIKPGELRLELDKNQKKLENIMNFQQRKLIYPVYGNTSPVIKDLDISVLYIILRNICKIPQHFNGWGNYPFPSDKSISACIDRIRQLRNLISGHSTNGRVEEIEFKNYWAELRNAVVEIERQLVGGNLYERGVDYLLNCDIPHVRVNTFDKIQEPPNVIIGHDTDLDNNAVILIAKVFPSDKASVIGKVNWFKNGVKIDIQRRGGKYSKISTGNSSLKINNVNQQDAGSYQLIAVNSVGSTVSDTIIIDVPKIFIEINELKEDRSKLFKVTIQSVPAPLYAQWKIKEKDDDAFGFLDVNAEEHRGSQNSLPHPVLVVRHTERLKTQIFQIEVHNFIGSSRRIITADMPPVILETAKLAVGLETFYDEKGASVRFSNLFHDLAENVPCSKTEQLKDLIENSCKIEDMLSLKQASSPRDCFRILKDAKLFTSSDIIFIQYLLKKIDCTELFEKCYEYAEAQKALCFYEKPPENGYKNVQFHVRGNLSEYSPIQIEKIKETVAVIVGCSSKEVHVGGFAPTTSFLVVLSLKEIYLEQLYNLEQWQKDRLIEVNIDYFIVDLKIIYIDSSKDDSYDLPEPESDYQDDDVIDAPTEKENTIDMLSHFLQEKVILRERKSSNSDLDKRLSDPWNDELLIKPKKLANPCIASPARMAVHKELLLNYKLGKNVLEKPELNKVFEKVKEKHRVQEWESQKKPTKLTSLEMKLEQQASWLIEQEDFMKPIKEKAEKESELSRIQSKIPASPSTVQPATRRSSRNPGHPHLHPSTERI